MSSLAERLKQARTNAHLGQRELAKQLGLSPQTISNYENEARTPGRHQLLEIAKLLDVNIAWLQDGAGPMRNEPEVRLEPDSNFSVAHVVVPLWKGVLAFDGFEGEGSYERDGLFEIPAFFLGGRDPSQFQAISVQGMSMSPRIQSGEKVIIRTGSDMVSGSIVLLQDPSGKAFLKVLELSPKPRAISINSVGKVFDDLSGWQIVGHAVGIYGDPEKGTRNIEYADGRVLRA